jgi:WD repeat-containing protein 6
VRMITGGDDNAIQLSEISISSSITWRILALVRDAHTSTVTGVLSWGISEYLSIGIDQRIRLWRYEDGNLNCVFDGYTFVPDVCGIVDVGVSGEKRRLVVYGTGIEMLELEA